jgi:hypothetical protein
MMQAPGTSVIDVSLYFFANKKPRMWMKEYSKVSLVGRVTVTCST